jgi:hypothetical protein
MPLNDVNRPEVAPTITTAIPEKKEKNRRLCRHSGPILWSTCFQLPITTSVSNEWIMDVSLTALWKHWLYARGLVPLPVHQLLRAWSEVHVAASRPAVRTKATMETFAKDLSDQLCSCSVESGHDVIDTIVFVIGSSWSRPKEVYVVRNNLLRNETKENHGTDKDRASLLEKKASLSSRLVRQVIQSEGLADNQQPAKQVQQSTRRATSDQLFCILGYKQLPISASSTAGSHSSMMIVRHDFDLETLIGKRTVKRVGRLELVRAGEQQAECCTPLIWCSLQTSVKGFGMTPSSRLVRTQLPVL